MIHIYDGNPGQGKTYMLALETLRLIKRNHSWWINKKIKNPRLIVTNMALSGQLVAKYGYMIRYWQDLKQLVGVREADVIFDDMSTYLDGQRWLDTPTKVKRWLRLHEHYGCDIYGNAQDYLSIDISARRLITNVTNVRKLIGSRRPSATKPDIKFVWGVLLLREVGEDDINRERTKRQLHGLPRLEFLQKYVCQVFDTTQEFQQGDYPPLEHIERICTVCNELKTSHR